MVHRRWILGALLVVDCTPHEGSQEPIAECPAGMVAIEGGSLGDQKIPRICMDLEEVTTAAYASCVAAGACTPALVGDGAACNLTHAGRGAHPINCVGIDQAQAHCGWLGKRLPEDAEWSWAARGGLRDTPYPWGRRPLDATRACHDRTALGTGTTGAVGTCEVGDFPAGASPEGLLDLVGNVAEWTRGEHPRLRGGSWKDGKDLDPAGSEPTDPATPTSGFRCAVLPFTQVQALEVDTWTPVKPVREALPRLAETPTRTPPTRPLANLALLDRNGDRPDEPQTWWPLGDSIIGLPPATAATLALTDPIDPTTLPALLSSFRPVRNLGETFLMLSTRYNDPTFIAVERSGFKIRWQAALAAEGTMYFHFVAPQTLVASFYASPSDLLVGLSLGSGRELWRIRGDLTAPFTRIKQTWTDGERGYLIGDRGLVAFDLVTGATSWSTAPFDASCGVASGDGVLVIEDIDGHRVLDPATGLVTGRIQAGVSECSWGRSSFDGGVAMPAIDQGQLLAFDPPTPRGATRLRAFDLRTGAERWRRSGFDSTRLIADHDAVYVARDEIVLVALDASTGAKRAEISIGDSFKFNVAGGGGVAGPLLRVDSGNGTWLLGRAAEPPVPENFVVRGRLVAEGVPRARLAGVLVRLGDHKVRTDAEGRFEIRGQTLGAVLVTMGDPRPPEDYRQHRVRFDDVVVPLTGRGSYRVEDIPLYWWSTA